MFHFIKNNSIPRLKIVVCPCIIVFGISACGDSNESNNPNNASGVLQEINYSILHDGNNGTSQALEKDFLTLLTQQDYEAKLREFSRDRPLNIDFSSQRVLFVSMGRQISGGFSIDVTRIQEFNDGFVATAVPISPGDNCLVTSALTHPYMFIQLTSQDDEIQVFEENVVVDCT